MQKEDCLFCKMARGDIQVNKIYENEILFVINDIHPQAEVHRLIIFKQHYDNFLDPKIQTTEGRADMAALVQAIPKIAEIGNLAESGFRIIQNNGAGIGQSVMHMHFHFMYDPKFKDQL